MSDRTELTAHTAPLGTRRVVLRWTTYWEPRVVVEAKTHYDIVNGFHILKLAYKRRVDTLLRVRIAWSSIVRNNLDSPFLLGIEFDRALSLAIERRRCRLGREKGKGKKYDHQPRSRSK